MMNDFDRTLELINESQNSAGAAAEQYAIYQDSAAAATARLTAAWEEFYSKIVNSEQIIWVINALEKLVETMSKIGPIGTAIGTTIGALGLNLLGKAVIPNITKNLANVASTGQAASLSIGALAKGGGALLLTFGKVAAVIAVVAAAIAGIVWVVKQLDKAFHKDREEAKALNKEIEKLNKEISNSDTKINSLEKLLKQYDKLNKKVYLTEEEQKELNDTILEIENVSERAIISIDEIGNAHLRNRDAISAELEQEKEIQAWRESQRLEKEIGWISNPESEKNPENLQNNGFVNMARVEATRPTISENRIKEAQEGIEYLNSFTLQNSTELYKEYGELIKKESDEILKKLKKSELFKDVDLSQIESISELERVALNLGGEKYQQYSELYLQTIKNIIDETNRYTETISLAEKQQSDYNKSLYEAGIQDYTNKALEYSKSQYSVNPKSQIITEALENGAFELDSLESLAYFYDNFYNLINNLDVLKAFDNFNKSNKTDQDRTQLQNALAIAGETLAVSVHDKLIRDAEEAAKNYDKRKDERTQFVLDNLDFFVGTLKGNEQIKNDFIADDSITSDDLTYLGEMFKNNNLSDNEKLSIFDLIIKDDKDEINKLIKDYVNKMEAGLFSEADEIKEIIIKLMTDFGIPSEAIEEFINSFITDTEGVAEKRLSNAKDNYNTAKSIYNKAPQESLNDKEYGFLKQQNQNIDAYININQEGEKYLSILGKVAVLENTRNEYAKSLNDRIEANNTQIKYYQDVLNGNVELTEDELKDKERVLKVSQDQIDVLMQENNLLEQELITTDNIVDKTMSISFKENLSQAEQTYENINKIGKALGEAQQSAGQLSFATAQSLLAMDDAYYQYINIVDGMVKLDTDSANKMMENEKAKYDTWLDGERKKLKEQIAIYEAENLLIQQYFSEEGEFAGKTTEEKLKLLQTELTKKEDQLNNLNKANVDANKEGLIENANYLTLMDAQWSDYYANQVKANNAFKKGLASAGEMNLQSVTQFLKGVKDNSKNLKASVDIKIDEVDWNEEDVHKIEQQLRDKFNANLKRIEIIQGVLDGLEDLSPAFKEAFEKGLSEAAKSGTKALQNLNKIINDIVDALKDLDDLLKETKENLSGITVDYNPFTDLFEAWEKEWDYYYNIKRLIAEIGTQGQFIDNIISADYVSADKRVQAYHAKIGNLLAQMSANDAYIESLRTGMSQNAVELMKEFGDYYKVDPNTGQIYQTDKNLTDINETINQTGEEIYNLQKLQSEKENNLALEEAKLDALEQEKSAYEEILSTIESQIDSLKDNEDITVDLSELESKRDTIKADIEVSEDSIEAAKDKINGMEDEIQEIEIQITLKEKLKGDLENYVDRMEDKVSEYEEYWENLNSTIAEQQELLQNLTEIYNTYIDTAISTQQDLYNAIVENYQREIDNKKKEYDELKQLDNDYLASVKDNISKERQAREDNKKQRSYQQSLQRAQLLQMDTSGAFRTELNDLKNSIEQQREDLYDDLVDKQVEALEKEIEKRHELYDKEVAALEERLAYMQENAILLWEMVNEIIAQGSNNMMSTLEGTMDYINSTELSRQRQRREWENNVKMTFDGVKNGTINMLNSLIQAGNNYITKELPEINKSLDEYNQVFINASETMNNYNAQVLESLNILKDDTKLSSEAFHSILNSFMTTWNDRTNEFTAYAQNWADITASLKQQAKKNLSDLKEFYDKEGKVREENLGSIKKYNEELERTYTEMYDDFLEERRRYRDELESLIDSIRDEIEAAVKDAADAIRSAVDSLSAGGKDDITGEGTGEGNTPTNPKPNPGNGNGEPEKKHLYRVQLTGYKTFGDYIQNKNGINAGTVSRYSENEAIKAAGEEIMRLLSLPEYKNWYFRHGGAVMAYAKGGLANFTGPAWLDGTASSPERVLSPHQTKLFESMVSSLERASNNSNINSALGSSYNIGDINTSIQVAKLDNQTDINQLAKQVEDKIVKTIRNRVTISV